MTTHTPHGQPAIPATGAWLKLSAAMAAEVPAIANRDDVVVTCAPSAGQGNPACFWPDRAHIEVDGKLLGVDPAAADPARPSDRDRYPVAWGALTHECAHAAHSKWNPPDGAVAAWADRPVHRRRSRNRRRAASGPRRRRHSRKDRNPCRRTSGGSTHRDRPPR